MSVTIYRRHLGTCPHKSKGRSFSKCGCPFWADARPIGPLQSLGTTDRLRALEIARDMELNAHALPSREAVKVKAAKTIADGKEAFFANLVSRNLAAATQYKHEMLWRQCLAFAKANDLVHVSDFDATMIDLFMGTWKDAANARGKKLERFKQFFKFAVTREWIEKNPMNGMKGPIVKQKQTPPLTLNEMKKTLAKVDTKIREARSDAKQNWILARALIYFLRYSGLRIVDAVGCQQEWVANGRVRLITRKTNKHIDVELPPFVIKILSEIPAKSDLYFFWSGRGDIETAVKDWQGRLAEIFKDAGINGGHAHRLRDTFAVDLLERGESLQSVADALGNSLAVTQRHYNPWSKKRQSQLDEAVSGGWKSDPLLKVEDPAAAKLRARRVM